MASKKRRQYGTGSIYQRSSDGRWIGALVVGLTPEGRQRRAVVSAADRFPDEASAKAAIKRLLSARVKELAVNGAPVIGAGAATVKTWAAIWLTRTTKTVRPKSWANNRSNVDLYIVPTIGRKRLDALTPADIRSVTDAARANDCNSTTALRIHRVLIKMLKDAVLEGHQVPQRVLMVPGPKKSTSHRSAIPTSDAHAMLKCAIAQPGGSRWVAAFLQGMRQGECLGLCWSAIDLDTGVLDVSWQLQAINYKHGCERGKDAWSCGKRFGSHCPKRFLGVPDGYEFRQLSGNLCLVRPKSEKGSRLIPLVPWMNASLQAWRDKCPSSPHDLVWARSDGRPMSAADDSRAWVRLQVDAGVRKTDGINERHYLLHEARHTTATLLLEAGVDPEVVKAIMGHSSIITSRLYQTVSQDLARKALDSLAAKLELSGGN